jgi:hypothetical protein
MNHLHALAPPKSTCLIYFLFCFHILFPVCLRFLAPWMQTLMKRNRAARTGLISSASSVIPEGLASPSSSVQSGYAG